MALSCADNTPLTPTTLDGCPQPEPTHTYQLSRRCAKGSGIACRARKGCAVSLHCYAQPTSTRHPSFRPGTACFACSPRGLYTLSLSSTFRPGTPTLESSATGALNSTLLSVENPQHSYGSPRPALHAPSCHCPIPRLFPRGIPAHWHSTSSSAHSHSHSGNGEPSTDCPINCLYNVPFTKQGPPVGMRLPHVAEKKFLYVFFRTFSLSKHAQHAAPDRG